MEKSICHNRLQIVKRGCPRMYEDNVKSVYLSHQPCWRYWRGA